jgi:hypothetical protein
VSGGAEPASGLAAALLQIAAQAERHGALDAREAGHWTEVSGRLRELARQAEDLASVADQHGQLLDGIAAQLADDDGEPGAAYAPIPAPQWWRLEGEDRAKAITRLRAWVDMVYRPSYGHLSEALPACWAEHPLALFTLDWLSELHSVLYLQPKRSGGMLTSQAEWQTRLLPAAVEQLTREMRGCQHRKAAR